MNQEGKIKETEKENRPTKEIERGRRIRKP